MCVWSEGGCFIACGTLGSCRATVLNSYIRERSNRCVGDGLGAKKVCTQGGTTRGTRPHDAYSFEIFRVALLCFLSSDLFRTLASLHLSV